MYKTVTAEDISVGDEVTIWFMPDGQSGQGGILQPQSHGKFVTLIAPGDRVFQYLPRDIHHYTMDTPGEARECLNYGYDGSDCEGPVEMWHPGGMGYRSFPRCTKHGEARLNNRSELERYADSDVPPPNFREDDIGERWSDDY